MPRATRVMDVDHKELTTLEGAFVDLRRMSFGQSVQRRAMTKLTVEFGNAGTKNQSIAGELAMASEEITRFEFTNCIVDHNLEAEDGRKLNLNDPVDFASLDPRVGGEIEALIEEMNNFDEDDRKN